MQKNYNDLKKFVQSYGDLLFGVANVEPFRHYWIELPPEAIAELPYGISVGFPLSRRVLLSIKEQPTRLYSYHYKQINYFLDRIGLLVTNYIQARGHQALPIPASQTIDRQKRKGHISHKDIAIAAGLGWLGRNNLVVSPQHGAAVRLVTILSDYPLKVDKIINANCGTCQKCISQCPAGCIKLEPKEFDADSCYRQLCEFQKIPGVGHHICGICVRACFEV